MSHQTEYIWTCKIGGPAIQFQSGADAPMRQAVQAAFKQVTGNDEVFCFSGWGGELTEPERAVVENRLPSDEYEAEWNRRAAVQAAQPEAVGWRALAEETHARLLKAQIFDLATKWSAMLASAPTEPMSAPTARHCEYNSGTCTRRGCAAGCQAMRLIADAAPTEAKPAQQDAVDAELEPYDAGLLNDFGGGNVEWWQDYIRAELGRANDFYQTQFAAISAKKGGAA